MTKSGPISWDRKVSTSAEAAIEVLDGESVILDLKSGRYFGLDMVGTRMLQVLDDSDSIQSAYEVLLELYEVEPETLRTELNRFLGELAARDLVQSDP